MPQNPKVQVQWQQEDAMWIIACGKLEEPRGVSTVELRERFFVFLRAAEEFMRTLTSPPSEDNMEALLGCAASSLAKIVPSRKRFALYISEYCVFPGIQVRTQLPYGLEEAITQMWTEPDETFVGYKDAE